MGPYKDLIIAFVALVAIGWFAHAQRVDQRNADAVAAQQAEAKEAAHVAQVNANATASIQDLQTRFAAALAAPAQPSLVVRVCLPRAGAPNAGTAGAGPSPASDGASGSGSGVGKDDLGLDIAPPTEAILKRDKTLIDYLQGYVRTCQTAGLCAK